MDKHIECMCYRNANLKEFVFKELIRKFFRLVSLMSFFFLKTYILLYKLPHTITNLLYSSSRYFSTLKVYLRVLQYPRIGLNMLFLVPMLSMC